MVDNTVDNMAIYDENWEQWHDMKVFGPASRWLRKLIIELLGVISNDNSIESILDVGCGEGTNSYYIANLFKKAKIVGIDFSKAGIEAGKKYYKLPNLEFVHDINSDYLKQIYSMVTCFEVLEHVDDWKNLVERMANSSNKYLLFSFPVGKMRPYEINVGHVRNFKKGEVESFLRSLSFEPVQIYYAGFPFFSPLYREICNLTNAANNGFTKGNYTWLQKALSTIFYFSFEYLSTRDNRGDQFCGLFKRI